MGKISVCQMHIWTLCERIAFVLHFKKQKMEDGGKNLTIGRTGAIYLILENNSCLKEVTYLRVGWKLRVKDKNA